VGLASPGQVQALVERVRIEFGANCAIGLHLHDTRGLALANAMAGLDAGVRLFDASIGGIGGCPFSPGATGNVCTEDLVHMLELEGFDTGIELASLVDVGRDAAERLAVASRSAVLVAGPSWAVSTALAD
jgi:hydroxymethylglutaryl-CoA lyase